MAVESDAFFVRMPDGSMAPRILERDWLCIDPEEAARDGGLVAVRDPETGRTTARRYEVAEGRRVVRATAPGWPEFVLDERNETMLLGAVEFVGREV